MTAFRQLCPSCKRTLELPVTAMGQLAQCPVCNERFAAGEQPATVDQSEPASEIGPSETGIASGPSPSESQADESQTDLKVEVDLTRVGLPEDADTGPTEAAEQIADVTTPTRDPISLEPFSSHSADSTTTDPIGSEFGKPTPTEAESGKPPTHHVPAGSIPEYPEGVNPFSVPLSQASPLPGLENPYLSPQQLSSGNFARRGEVIIVSRSISEILKDNLGTSLEPGNSSAGIFPVHLICHCRNGSLCHDLQGATQPICH